MHWIIAHKRLIALSLTGFILSACGSVQVPSDGSGLIFSEQDQTAPSSTRTTSSSARATTQRQDQPRQIPGTVIVQKGDTVYAISRKHNASVRAIIETNNLQPPFHLKAGQRLKLPQGPVHVVQAGDTLYSVSRAYQTDVYTLAKRNNLKSPFTLTPGQRLTLPNAKNFVSASRTLKQTPRVTAEPLSKPSTVRKAPVRISKKSIPKPPPRASSRFSWPIEGKLLSSFGAKNEGLHNDGINIAAKRGTPVKAAENGVVAYSGNELRGFGNMLLVKHSGGWITAYAHADQLLVNRGDKVRKGQTIAKVGSTGSVTTPQLHFEIRKGMNPVNPKKYLGG